MVIKLDNGLNLYLTDNEFPDNQLKRVVEMDSDSLYKIGLPNTKVGELEIEKFL